MFSCYKCSNFSRSYSHPQSQNITLEQFPAYWGFHLSPSIATDMLHIQSLRTGKDAILTACGKPQEASAPAPFSKLPGAISVLFDGKSPGGGGVQLGSVGKADSVWGFLLSRSGCIWITSLSALSQHSAWDIPCTPTP